MVASSQIQQGGEGHQIQVYLIAGFITVGMGVTLFLLNMLLPEWRWPNEPVHASVEAIGAIVAVILGVFLYQREPDAYSGEAALVSIGVICMGLLDGVHGMTRPGAAFVFLHSVASLVGGFWFALIWLPRSFTRENVAHAYWIPWTAGVTCVVLGTLAALRQDLLPVMSYDGNFSLVATGINMLAGVLFLVAVPRFVKSYNESGKAEIVLFIWIALLFGISELTFKFSALWDAGWWLWHLLRLIAYLISLFYLIWGYAQVNLKQRQAQEEIRQHRDNLEQVVAERTAVLEEQTATLQKTKGDLQTAVQAYSVFAEQVARGNLTARMNPTGNEELDMLGENLNRMVERLRDMTMQIRGAANNIASATTEILSATTQQASSSAEQSSATTQASATVEEVRAIAEQTSSQSGRAAEESKKMLEAAQRGTQIVENNIDGMGKIRQKVESIAQTILALSEQTQAIGDITRTVSELADQSNMLALNAAIEAARAGEQGKSFAVVAQQVRELAERSKSATAQVQDILNEIQRATNTAVMVTEEGTKGVEEGVRLSEAAGQTIHEIALEVERGSQSNTQMAAAAHQQTIGMEQILQAMKAIQQAATQTLASTRQAEQAARDLHALAQTLQQTVAVYEV